MTINAAQGNAIGDAAKKNYETRAEIQK